MFYTNPEVFQCLSTLKKQDLITHRWVNVNASPPNGRAVPPSLHMVFTDIENLLFTDARKVDDPARLTPSLQSLGNPGTSYMERRDFPLFQERGKANSYSGNIETASIAGVMLHVPF